LKNANLKIFEFLSPKYERDNIKLGLSRIKKALQELGNPCKNIPAIQIIGTNGKGSIAAYLESILFEAKRNFGVTTSPHLFDICERIRVNKKNINEIKKEPRILRSINSEVGLQTIMSVGLFETDTFQFGKNKKNVEDHSHDHSSHSHDHSSHSHDLNNIEGFTSVSYETFEPFSLRKFQYFLDNQISQNVFRAKGILWFMESDRKHIFHLSGKRFSLDDEEWTKEKSNKIVLIGKNLDHQTIKKQLSSCRFSTD